MIRCIVQFGVQTNGTIRYVKEKEKNQTDEQKPDIYVLRINK